MAEVGSLDIVIRVDTRKFTAAISDVKRQVGQTATSMKKLSAGFGQAGRGFAAVGRAGKGLFKTIFSLKTAFVGLAAVLGARKLISFAAAAVKSSDAAELAVARLTAGLKNVPGVSKGATKALTQQAAALQKITTFADEQIVSAQAMLATFQLNDKQITKITPRILDMAASLEKSSGATVDLEQLSIAVGKALGPGGTSGALKRYGVALTAAQADQFDAAKGAERLNLLMKILDSNFKGVAKAAGDTAAGKIRQFQNQIDDVREAIGDRLKPILVTVISTIQKFVAQNLPRLRAAFEAIKKAIGITAAGAGEFAKTLTDKVLNAVLRMIEGLPTFIAQLKEVLAIVLRIAAPFARFVRAVVEFAINHQKLAIAVGVILGLNKLGIFSLALGAIKFVSAIVQLAAPAIAGGIQALGLSFTALLGPIAVVVAAAAAAIAIFRSLKDLAETRIATDLARANTSENITKLIQITREKDKARAARARQGLKNIGVQGFAKGGLIRKFASGTDSVPALLTPGEMVLNARQQRNLFSSLGGNTSSNKSSNTFHINGGLHPRTIADLVIRRMSHSF